MRINVEGKTMSNNNLQGSGAPKTYDVQDVINAGYNLEPLKCRYCESLEVTYMQYIGDAQCSGCGEWQLGEDTL